MSNEKNRKNYFYGGFNADTNNFDENDIKYIDPSAPLEELALPVRLHNAIKKNGVISLGGLVDLSAKNLYKIRNISSKSVKLLDDQIFSYLEERKRIGLKGLETQKKKLEELSLKDYDDLLETLFIRLSDNRCIKVLKMRFGLGGYRPMTLEEVGKEFGVTRERIRQIEAKSLRRLVPSSTGYRKLLRDSLSKWMISRGGAVGEQEADEYFLSDGGFDKYDGSSVLDLFSEINIVSNTRRKGIVIYSSVLTEMKLERILTKAEQILSQSKESLSIKAIKAKMGLRNKLFVEYMPDLWVSSQLFLEKLFELMPTIAEVYEDKAKAYTMHSNRKYFPQYWSDVIYRVIKDEDGPLHFTEITERVNDLKMFNRSLDVRRTMGVLLDDKRFAHTGIKGTYGLTEWGIRKEMLPDLIKECMNDAGFPLHFDQIFNFVSKYKYTKKTNVYACLNSNRHFYRLSNGLYWLKEKKNEY